MGDTRTEECRAIRNDGVVDLDSEEPSSTQQTTLHAVSDCFLGKSKTGQV